MFHQYVVASAFVIVSFASIVTGELFSNNKTTFIAFILTFQRVSSLILLSALLPIYIMFKLVLKAKNIFCLRLLRCGVLILEFVCVRSTNMAYCHKRQYVKL